MFFDTSRFRFIAEALDASGGFRPQINYEQDSTGLWKPTTVSAGSYLTPYPRESAKKFAARAAVAVYQNHLRESTERFVGYMAKKPPARDKTNGDLVQQFITDCDWNGNSLDIFWQSFALQAKARGTMLLVMDMPAAVPENLAEQLAKRAIPYLVAVKPERVLEFELNEFGRFESIKIVATQNINGKLETVHRFWDAKKWSVYRSQGSQAIQEGEHGFGRCPVEIFTEAGQFPYYGSFEQIAQLSCRLYNARSELDEILRSQTFSLLTYEVSPENMSVFDGAKVAAEIGTSNMLIHQGAQPGFIAPADGPAATYLAYIDSLEASIKRMSMTIEDTASAVQSGIALTIRFQTLNSVLGSFARRMEDLERRTWDLFSKVVGQSSKPTVSWHTDYSFADVVYELDVLTGMQATGFPDAVLREKRKQILAADMPSTDEKKKAELNEAIDQKTYEVVTDTTPGQSDAAPNNGIGQ